jgi:hypothetical protein
MLFYPGNPWHIFFDLVCIFANLLYPFLSASLRFHLYSLQCSCGIHFSTISTLFISFLLPFLIISLISHNFSIYSSPFLCSSLDFSHYPHFSTLSSLHVSGRVSTSQAVAQVLGSNVLDLTVTECASHMRASIFLAD